MIYADNAATTKMCAAAVNAMLSCMAGTWGNPSSLHSVGQAAAEAMRDARDRIAACIGAQAKEIVFTSGGSESDNQALLSAARLGKRQGKTHIISSAFEHHAVLHTLKRLASEGFEVELLPVGMLGTITAQQVANAIREDTALVTIMYANNEIGSILPIQEIGEVCRANGVTFHTDAVQAAGHLPIHVQRQNIDMLSLSAHKFHGPKGIGALYVRQGIPLTSIIEGGAQERGRRAGTENVPAIVGMAAALEEACTRMTENTAKTAALRNRLIEGLTQIPNAILNGGPQNRLPGNVSFCFEGIEGESLVLLLNGKGICASTGSACASSSLEPSHVLLAIGRSREAANGALRVSLCEDNTDADVDAILEAVPDIVSHLRSKSLQWLETVGRRDGFVL